MKESYYPSTTKQNCEELTKACLFRFFLAFLGSIPAPRYLVYGEDPSTFGPLKQVSYRMTFLTCCGGEKF